MELLEGAIAAVLPGPGGAVAPGPLPVELQSAAVVQAAQRPAPAPRSSARGGNRKKSLKEKSHSLLFIRFRVGRALDQKVCAHSGKCVHTFLD